MQVTDKKTLLEYDAYCQKKYRKKIPDLKSKDIHRAHFDFAQCPIFSSASL
jgi:hypothetical protein